ncbi:diguanylate cyclase [Marinomonas sp. A79]|uniref:diguanylate cyclase n=1 Tax=Marinomonas vulgaris TaxID=2823372 RepID=A0ABS5H934_9GAMM|nr:diguanylate cyclase [Marinomonas vulgaris]MBR7888203.1 diguanylate cyclase [Marinomonas vulgaris]
MKIWQKVQTHTHKSAIYISLIILCIDLIFIAINYYTSHKALENSLLHRAQIHQQEFNLTLDMTYRDMLQLSTFISTNDELNQLFLAGKKAVEKEGMYSDSVSALRKALLDKVKIPWDLTSEKFDVRQLHYQLGPGSLSYLRVHEPNRFGDRMDNTRYTIVDTNADQQERSGFETGRVYSGLRGVSPVWTQDPDTNQRTYVGAVEVGTSFNQILPVFARSFDVESAVFLTKEHVGETMWQSYVGSYFKETSDVDYYTEASSSETSRDILNQTPIKKNFITYETEIIKENDRYLSSFHFPLFDYKGTNDATLPPVGFVLIWEDVTDMIEAFKHSFLINIAFSLVAFILIECFLLWILGRERKLSIAEQEALVDGLTGLYNRRYYDAMITKEEEQARHNQTSLSVIICDIDYFKRFNDAYGHPEGDTALKQVASAIRHTIHGTTGMACRYGGEEFVIILPNTDLRFAVALANRIQAAVHARHIPHKASPVETRLTLSLGVACSINLDNKDSLIVAADAQLYAAKDKGRNRTEPDLG